MRLLLALLLCWLALPALAESAPQDPDARFLASAPAAIAHATRLLDQDDARGAARFLTKAREQFADDADLAQALGPGESGRSITAGSKVGAVLQMHSSTALHTAPQGAR